MVDIDKEQAISLVEATKLLPSKASGKRISVRTVERWIKYGHRGVKLDGCAYGATLGTSREALKRFSEALMLRKTGGQSSPASDGEGNLADLQAAEELKAAGY